MKRITKCMALALAFFLTVGVLTACSNQDTDQTTVGQTTGTDAPSQEPEDTDDSGTEPGSNFDELITFTMSTISADVAGKQPDGSEAANYTWLKEQYNIDFEFWNLTWSDYVELTRTWINSDTAPEIMMLDVAGSRFAEYLDWVAAGRFRPYDLDDFATLNETFNKMNTGKQFAVDGELYAWPSMTDLEDFNWVRPGGYLYRTDWAEEVGGLNDDHIYGFDEWFDLAEKVVQEDPGNNGAGQTIGIITGWDWAFPQYVTGQMSPWFKTYKQDDNGDWLWGGSLDETYEMMKYTKDLYDRGVIWADQALVKDGDETNNFVANKAFASVVYGVLPSTIEDMVLAYQDGNPGTDASDIICFALVRGQDGKFVGWQDPDQWSQTAMNAKIDEDKAIRWQHVLDFLVSDEGYLFRNYGLEGIDWEYQGDEVVALWEEDENGIPANPYGGTWQWGRPGGNNDGFSLYSPQFPEWIREMTLNAYELFADPNEAHVIEIYPPFYYYSSQEFVDATANIEGVGEMFTQLITSNDFEGEWRAWVESKEADVAAALEDLNANVD